MVPINVSHWGNYIFYFTALCVLDFKAHVYDMKLLSWAYKISTQNNTNAKCNVRRPKLSLLTLPKVGRYEGYIVFALFVSTAKAIMV